MSNPAVKSLLLDIDSGEVEANGLFDLCDYLAGLRGRKPLVAVANDAAFSAAYAIASCCDRIFLTSVGGVGSIGVFALHIDQSKYDEQQGLSYTYVKSGDRKIDANPHEPLSGSARADLQSECDRVRDMFVDMVAGNRGVSAQAVRETEAATFMGSKAIPLLADAVGSFDTAAARAQSTPDFRQELTAARQQLRSLAGSRSPARLLSEEWRAEIQRARDQLRHLK